ncbi:thiamine diphosphokinase [Cloacibacillus sp. An23]|uniref:thiamine diphosphokinase n=1 Tax=Cloacibacillus sp. An23 TaxID=1965591 RepID=UPI000B37477F|nr:thiamine diphosphokinase [Cloacibacillus sp. An23]OUO92934.1 thiamine diphosphokinase [Cloacibacillus sp. An23]
MELPGIAIENENIAEGGLCVMVLGGRAPSPEFLARAAEYGEVWAVDRGVEACRAAGIVPAMLVGDRDSGSAEAWRWAEENGAPVREYQSDKDLTDFQLALKIFVESHKNNGKKLFLTGALGGRFDHLWSLVISFLNLAPRGVQLCAADDHEGLLFLHGPQSYSLEFARKPKAVSLLSFSPRCEGVCISGVRWPLSCAELSYGFPYAVSNRVDGDGRVDVSCGYGTLGLCWTWNDAF